ncbi:glycosyl hydrolase [Apodospora peruviana]|uniref:Glycosyl hydrolase n=1 Tax=Apodospora peruviana TaxID=516989 RepID=A0AAE0HX85_9PEZI|nr:glycosyl hydrolase [Apodospora peruviana]
MNSSPPDIYRSITFDQTSNWVKARLCIQTQPPFTSIAHQLQLVFTSGPFLYSTMRLTLWSGLFFGLALPTLANVPSGITDRDLSILAGSHVIYSWPSTVEPPNSLLQAVRDGLVGGVILFGENVGNGTPAALQSLQSAYKASPAPAVFRKYVGMDGALFLTTDQEGGKVRRIKDGGPYLTAKQIGASADPAAAGKTAGEDAAASLKRYNFNANLAPVLDIYREAGNFIDSYERSYGNTSALVSKPATEFVKAQQAAGIPATVKHFPGLGAAARQANTDLEPVTLSLTLQEIRNVDEIPYTYAIAAGVDLVMASWAIYPAMDKLPSGLSSKWIEDELRGRLGFKGVTITDALEAGSLAPFGNLPTVSLMAAKAGMDMLLASERNVTQGVVVRAALIDALKSGNLGWADFMASTLRIMTLRKKL